MVHEYAAWHSVSNHSSPSHLCSSREPVQVHSAVSAGRGAGVRPLQQHGRAAAVQAVPARVPAAAAGGRRCGGGPTPLLPRLPLHPAQLAAHRLPERHHAPQGQRQLQRLPAGEQQQKEVEEEEPQLAVPALATRGRMLSSGTEHGRHSTAKT